MTDTSTVAAIAHGMLCLAIGSGLGRRGRRRFYLKLVGESGGKCGSGVPFTFPFLILYGGSKRGQVAI